MEFASPSFWIAAVEIVVVNILLSGDNAVVIALACRNLPPRQRKLGIAWGVAGAVVLRVVLTVFAAELLHWSYLRLVGAVLLLWIGVKLMLDEQDGDPEVEGHQRLLGAVRTVVLADLVMSLDNVVGVAGAARGNIPLLIFGLLLSIPLVVVGSGLVLALIGRFPILVSLGGALLGYLAGDIATGDTAVRSWIDMQAPQLHWIAPLAGGLFVVGTGWWMQRRRAAKDR